MPDKNKAIIKKKRKIAFAISVLVVLLANVLFYLYQTTSQGQILLSPAQDAVQGVTSSLMMMIIGSFVISLVVILFLFYFFIMRNN